MPELILMDGLCFQQTGLIPDLMLSRMLGLLLGLMPGTGAVAATWRVPGSGCQALKNGCSRGGLILRRMGSENDAASQAEFRIGRVDDPELSGGDTLDRTFRFKDMEAVFLAVKFGLGEFRGVADFEANLGGMIPVGFAQKIGTHVTETAQTDGFTVLGLGLEAFGNIQDVAGDVLVHHVPRSRSGRGLYVGRWCGTRNRGGSRAVFRSLFR